jgi:hypothetical protein
LTNRSEWRSGPLITIFSATCADGFVGVGSFLLLRQLGSGGDSLDHPAHPLNDDQAKAQVVEPAKQIVAIAELQQATAG